MLFIDSTRGEGHSENTPEGDIVKAYAIGAEESHSNLDRIESNSTHSGKKGIEDNEMLNVSMREMEAIFDHLEGIAHMQQQIQQLEIKLQRLL